MDGAAPNPELFLHVRVIIGIVTGLSVARLLNGLARFVQHPNRDLIYPVHLGWALFLLTSIIHFWWFEFGLSHVPRWSFELYFFVICYAVLFFFICAVLFPDRMDEYAGFADYFHSRQRWFYGLLAALFAFDPLDTALKGVEHFRSFGIEYPIRQAILFALAIAAMFIPAGRYHVVFVIGALVTQVIWILWQFQFLA